MGLKDWSNCQQTHLVLSLHHINFQNLIRDAAFLVFYCPTLSYKTTDVYHTTTSSTYSGSFSDQSELYGTGPLCVTVLRSIPLMLPPPSSFLAYFRFCFLHSCGTQKCNYFCCQFTLSSPFLVIYISLFISLSLFQQIG